MYEFYCKFTLPFETIFLKGNASIWTKINSIQSYRLPNIKNKVNYDTFTQKKTKKQKNEELVFA